MAQKEGPQTGGGGGTVFSSNLSSNEVIDFYNFTNHLNIQSLIGKKFPPVYEHNEESPLVISTHVQSILDNWYLPTEHANSSLRKLQGNIDGQSIQFVFVNSVESTNTIYRPLGLGSQVQIYPTAYYSIADYRFVAGLVQIDKSIWQRMNRVNRLALILHERLRHIQITLGYTFDDEFLQKATVVLLACQPEPQFIQSIISSQFHSQIRSQIMSRLNNYANNCLLGKSQVISTP
jgi:hypothetical protein